MAHDSRFTCMNQYRDFVDKYALPQVLFFIQYLVQKISKNEGSGQPTLRFERLKGESIFDQLYKQVHKKSTKLFLVRNTESPFRAKFVGENSYDAGGPFRDVIENICAEITGRFFKPTSNMDALQDITSH